MSILTPIWETQGACDYWILFLFAVGFTLGFVFGLNIPDEEKKQVKP